MANTPYEYPGYMEHSRSFKVTCPACGALPMTRCYDERAPHGYMDGYTHLARESFAAREERETKNNPNCSGSGPHTSREVRVLPHSKSPMHGNDILCRGCFEREIAYRRDWNSNLGGFAKYDLPKWEELKVYETNG